MLAKESSQNIEKILGKNTIINKHPVLLKDLSTVPGMLRKMSGFQWSSTHCSTLVSYILLTAVSWQR